MNSFVLVTLISLVLLHSHFLRNCRAYTSSSLWISSSYKYFIPANLFRKNQSLWSIAQERDILKNSVTSSLKHVAYIVDGNGRWAVNRGLSRTDGHRQGAKTTVDIVKRSFECGISTVTLYIFSTENWKRPSSEVSNILVLLDDHLIKFHDYFREKKVRVVVMGQVDRLPLSTQVLIQSLGYEMSSSSSHHSPHSKEFERTLCLAISYGGRDDIVQACRSVAALSKSGALDEKDITEDLFSSLTLTGIHGIPDPDLIVRYSVLSTESIGPSSSRATDVPSLSMYSGLPESRDSRTSCSGSVRTVS